MKAFDWAEFLRSDSCLAIQDEKARQWLVTDQASSEHTYEPGALILREGERGDSIFVIGSGSVEALLSVSGAPEISLSILRRGETFGEMGFFERRPRSVLPGWAADRSVVSRGNQAPKTYLSRKALRNFPLGSYFAATFLNAGSCT